MVPPSDLRPVDHTCYIAKKLVHTWTGHTKGVQIVRFFPTYGHFILSGSYLKLIKVPKILLIKIGSLDSKIKLWSTQNDRKCMRTYMGHKEAVRDL